MSDKQKFLDARERAFIQMRIMNALSDAGLLAANFGFPLEDFLRIAETMYVGFTGALSEIAEEEVKKDEAKAEETPAPPTQVTAALAVGQTWDIEKSGICVITGTFSGRVHIRWLTGGFSGSAHRDDDAHPQFFSRPVAKKLSDQPKPSQNQIWCWGSAMTEYVLGNRREKDLPKDRHGWFATTLKGSRSGFIYDDDFAKGRLTFSGYVDDARRPGR